MSDMETQMIECEIDPEWILQTDSFGVLGLTDRI